MTRYVVFSVANVDDDLGAPVSPWHSGGSVLIPLQYWRTLQDFAVTHSPRGLRALDALRSNAVDVPMSDELRRRYARYLRDLDALVDAVEKAPSVSLGVQRPPDDDLYSFEFARMVAALKAVVQRALALDQPVSSWVD